MKFLKLITKNAFRHKLRTFLTIFGLAIAVMAFIVIRTTVSAWYSQAEAASPNRLIVRHAVSLTFSLPLSYRNKIEKIEGISKIAHAQWFGGVYIDPKNFFAQFSIDHENYLEIYNDFIIEPEHLEAFNSQRNSCIVGRKLADRFGWSLGDQVQITGTIFPGDWGFIIKGIYTGKKETTDESQFLFRYDYLDERMRKEFPPLAGGVGMFAVQIDDPSQAANISQQIDKLFENSLAETLTETEESFQLSFVSMASSIVTGLKIISILVIGIILLVLANTMAMTARERISEYAVMKTLGFRPHHIIGMIFGESIIIAILGGVLGLVLTVPITKLVFIAISDWFPVFVVGTMTPILAMGASLLVGLVAAIFPSIKALKTPIVDGLRIID